MGAEPAAAHAVGGDQHGKYGKFPYYKAKIEVEKVWAWRSATLSLCTTVQLLGTRFTKRSVVLCLKRQRDRTLGGHAAGGGAGTGRGLDPADHDAWSRAFFSSHEAQRRPFPIAPFIDPLAILIAMGLNFMGLMQGTHAG